MSTNQELQDTLARHDKQIDSLTTQVGVINSKVDKLVSSMDGFMQRQSQSIEKRPSQIMEIIRTGLSILSTLAFLTGATVAAIVYVAGNANSPELAVMRHKLDPANSPEIAVMKFRLDQLERGQSWAPTVSKSAHVAQVHPEITAPSKAK